MLLLTQQFPAIKGLLIHLNYIHNDAAAKIELTTFQPSLESIILPNVMTNQGLSVNLLKKRVSISLTSENKTCEFNAYKLTRVM